mmetsp:Transcript_5608/g.14184  ORF Transcript_5608/g.14184 Transcript_5608/m.14184 type:complete len:427 (+) Transcript_5608:205-1485(+)
MTRQPGARCAVGQLPRSLADASWVLLAALIVFQAQGAAAHPKPQGRSLLAWEDYQIWKGLLPREESVAPRPVPEGTHYAYVHIPKVAGASFQRDSAKWMPVGVTLKGNAEALATDTAVRYPGAPRATLLRHPWKHVLSQFLHCKLSDGVLAQEAATHPGWQALVSPPEPTGRTGSIYKGLHKWLQHFLRPSVADFSDPKAFAFDCYNPWNLQSRYLTSVDSEQGGHRQKPSRYAHAVWGEGEKQPAVAGTITAARQLSFLGIADLYLPSLCLLRFQTTGSMPPECSCGVAPAGRSRQANLTHETHAVPPHSLDDLPLRVLRDIGRLVTTDARLYLDALHIFEARAREAASATGVHMLCGGQVEALRREVRALMELTEPRARVRVRAATRVKRARQAAVDQSARALQRRHLPGVPAWRDLLRLSHQL